MIPQLDGDKDRSKFSLKKMRNIRATIKNNKEGNYLDEEGDVDTNLLAERCPNYIDFIPTSKVVDKLFKRMENLKESEITKFRW